MASLRTTSHPALLILASLVFAAPGHSSEGDRYWNVGPMLHWEFGKHARGFTFGIETSYWWVDGVGSLPAGFDMGFELTRRRVRLYAEAQAGELGGVSAGPFLEFPLASEARAWGGRGPVLGIQGSVWAWWLAGADLRLRISPEDIVVSPGVFGKLGTCLGSCRLY